MATIEIKLPNVGLKQLGNNLYELSDGDDFIYVFSGNNPKESLHKDIIKLVDKNKLVLDFFREPRKKEILLNTIIEPGDFDRLMRDEKEYVYLRISEKYMKIDHKMFEILDVVHFFLKLFWKEDLADKKEKIPMHIPNIVVRFTFSLTEPYKDHFVRNSEGYTCTGFESMAIRGKGGIEEAIRKVIEPKIKDLEEKLRQEFRNIKIVT